MVVISFSFIERGRNVLSLFDITVVTLNACPGLGWKSVSQKHVGTGVLKLQSEGTLTENVKNDEQTRFTEVDVLHIAPPRA